MRTVFLVVCAVVGGVAARWTALATNVVHASTERPALGTPPAGEAIEDPVAAARATALSISTVRDFSRLLRLLEKLDAAQLATLFDQVCGGPPRVRDRALPALLSWWMSHDPEAATAWLQPELDRLRQVPAEDWGFDSYAGLIEAWVEVAPERAMALARECAGHPFARLLLEFRSRNHWEDHRGLFEVFRDFPDAKQRVKVLKEVFGRWASDDADAALEAAGTLPNGADRSDALAVILHGAVEEEPVPMLERAREFGVEEDWRFARILGVATDHKPAEVAAWMAQQETEFIAEYGRYVMERWWREDPVAAFDWAQKQGISPMAPSLLGDGAPLEDPLEPERSVMETALAGKFDGAAEWIAKLPAGPERDLYVLLALGQREHSGASLARRTELLALLSPEEVPNAVYRVARTSWVNDEAIAWARGLPPGPVRAQAWAGFGAAETNESKSEYVERLLNAASIPADRDAALASLALRVTRAIGEPETLDFARVLEIRDPALRRQTFDDAMAISAEEPERKGPAREWMEKAAVPEEWKEKWRAVLK